VIVVRQKDLDEITRMLSGHHRIMLVGCNTCAAVCLAGGEKEVETVEGLLRLVDSRSGTTRSYRHVVLDRQCEPEYVDSLQLAGVDAILSLGCGAGVALLAERTGLPTYPAVDTLFIGASQDTAAWRAECSACGSCVLGVTAGICPMTRCAKGILNGPCGGVNDGKCEVDPDRDCAWVLIYERLDAQGKSDAFEEIQPPKDFSSKTSLRAWEIAEDGDEE
jgi:ferredoxin